MSLTRIAERIHCFSDIANAYVIAAGRRALLIDSGGGGALGALSEIGVEGVDWVLHTHHHRDQCLGDAALVEHGARVAAPAREAHLLEDVERFWRTRETFDVYDGASTDNCLTTCVPVHRRLADHEVFEWEDLRIETFPTPGHTRGSVTYLTSVDGVDYAFSGDLIHSCGRVWTLHDLEWWYGMGEGARVAAHSVNALRGRRPHRIAPSHGAVIDEPEPALYELERNLGGYVAAADRGYTTQLGPDPLEPRGRFVQVSDHLIAAVGACANFYVLVSESGQSLFFDYGMASDAHCAAGFRFSEHSIAELGDAFGVAPPQVMVATHYHDDHVCGAPFLRERYGTEVWASARFSDILVRPFAYKLPCISGAPVHVSRHLSEDESVEWNEYNLTVRHNPGHTWYSSSIFLSVDDRRVAVVGDEIGVGPDARLWGNVPVWRNRTAPLDYVASIESLLDFDPEIVLTGHKGPLEISRAMLGEFREWALALDGKCRALTAEEDNGGFAWDPGFVSLDPYRLSVPPEGVRFIVRVRNHLAQPASATITPVVSDDWALTPPTRSIEVAAGATGETSFNLAPNGRTERDVRHALPIELQLGDRDFGQPAELLVTAS